MKSVKCQVASTVAEKNAILQQRYAIFVEEFHFFEPHDASDKIEYDRYDEHSLLLGVWEKENLIASCRLVLPNTTFGLPTLNSMIIDTNKLQSDQTTAEISRITVAAAHRTFKNTIKIMKIMQKELYRISSDYNIMQWVGAVEPSFLRLLQHSALPYVPIGPLQHLIGADRYPVILTIHDYSISMKEY